ncbi:sigma-54-dependent transcriptional regulator [Neobacillus massiliamazoniensis]|uniref:Putative two component sigma54 specific transcriptional regulator n=1 Tax=Neobacillus massiliamazoniensis TaxID=1499688 RepID=A0A0U1NY87_9BACI|nr:sigma-54 dependent transcriptional regulator [Neobacillus massiliamazoniensis]CRK82742.1 putative two component sigma54 specific transcriptional regulator [Neobacillus massiliamazoniensis]
MGTNRIIIVDDEKDLLELLVNRLKRKGYEVDFAENAEDAIPLVKCHFYDIAIYDIRLPKMDGISLLKETKKIQPEIQVIMLTGHGTIETAIEAMKLGAFDYLAKPYNLSELEIAIAKAIENKRLKEKNESMKTIIQQQNSFQIIGENDKFRALLDLTERVSNSDVPVLIEGESGTGKELFAKALHYWSFRAEEPFVAINSGALPEQLLESELFGHVKGAFTGANQDKKGLVEAANGGTLFLDELGEMPFTLQVKLLRFLETGEFRRVGDVRERKVKVRTVAATNRQLEKEVANGNFREDLYYRLHVLKLTIPPLRARMDDLPFLIDFFIKGRKTLSSEAIAALQSYHFPGNVRELHHLLERGILLSNGNTIEESDLLLSNVEKSSQKSLINMYSSLEQLEKDHIYKVLSEMGWNKTKAAEVLGVSVRNLYRKIDQYQLKVPI